METRKCSLLERQNERTLDLTAEQLQFYRQNEKLVYYFLNKMMISKQQWEELEEIGKILGTSQATIARGESKAKKELRSRLAEEAKQTRKFIFQVTIQKGKLQISFNPEAIANTKQVLQQLTLKAKENSININFKIYYSNRRAMLQFPLEQESFLLLALLLQIIEESKK